MSPRIMKYDPQRHHRRSIRLSGYDYSQPGAYFVTICTYDRELCLQAEQVREVVRSAWDNLPARFPHVLLDEFVMMPNHMYGLSSWRPRQGHRRVGAQQAGAQRAGAQRAAPLRWAELFEHSNPFLL